MRYVKWSLLALVLLLGVGFVHYTLPQRDVVRLVGTENRRVDFGGNSIFWASPASGTAANENRDVFFIQAVYPGGGTMEYRNEDTGWGWPPYFKFDSHSLQTRARDLVSSSEDPKWVVLTHYGWRAEVFTIFPNAVAVRQVDSPDVRLIPWLNIVILVALGAGLLFLAVLWRRFRERFIDPLMGEGRDAVDRIDAYADEKRSGLRKWLDRLRGK